MSLRIIFMGTPEFCVPTLYSIKEAGHDICAVYTQPPRPAGARGLHPIPSPIDRAASDLSLNVRRPQSLKDQEEKKAFAELKADVAIIVAYGLLLPSDILNGTRFGCYNAHASLLPRWRGAAPIQRAVMAGDSETGIMIMKMDLGLDTGPIALTEKVSIENNMTTGELHAIMMMRCADLVCHALKKLEDKDLTLAEQNEHGVLYAKKIEKSETRINWHKPAQEVHNHIRGLSPFPGAWCEIGCKKQRIKILRSMLCLQSGVPGTVLDDHLTIACKKDSVRLLEVQKAGGKILSGSDFLRGIRLEKGTVLSE